MYIVKQLFSIVVKLKKTAGIKETRMMSSNQSWQDKVESALALLSRVHIESSYPITEFEFDFVNQESYAKEQYENARIAIGWILEQFRKHGDEDE